MLQREVGLNGNISKEQRTSIRYVMFGGLLGLPVGVLAWLTGITSIVLTASFLVFAIVVLSPKALLRFMFFILPLIPLASLLVTEQDITGNIFFILYGFLIILSACSWLLSSPRVSVDKPMYLSVALFGFYLLASGLLSGYTRDIKGILVLLFVALPYFWFLLGGGVFARASNRRALCLSFILGATTSAIWFFLQVAAVIGTVADITWWVVVMAINVNLNNLGLFYVLGIALLLPLNLKSYRWTKWVMGILLWVAVLLTFSRSSYLALLSVIVYFFLKQRRNRLVFAAVVFGGIAVIMVVFPSLSQAVLGRIHFTWGYGQLDPSTAMRLLLWRDAVVSFLRNPVFGIGFGSPLALGIGLDPKALIFAHNYFLSLLSQLGFIGFLLGSYILLRGYQLSRKAELGEFGVGCRLAFIALIVASLFGEPLFWVGTLFLFMVLLSGVSYRELSS